MHAPGTVLEQIIGATAVALTAWQQAIVAGVFELCLAGAPRTGLRGTTHRRTRASTHARYSGPSEDRRLGSSRQAPACRPRTRPKPQVTIGSVETFVRDRLFPAECERIDMKALISDYRALTIRACARPRDHQSRREAGHGRGSRPRTG
jgi:hypothetical protein